jgi:hypothetical protein
MVWSICLSGSKALDRGPLELERDLPTTAEDVRALWELRRARLESALVNANRLLAPGWTLERAASQPLFEGCRPFTL